MQFCNVKPSFENYTTGRLKTQVKKAPPALRRALPGKKLAGRRELW
jgi:hypothetical protein